MQSINDSMNGIIGISFWSTWCCMFAAASAYSTLHRFTLSPVALSQFNCTCTLFLIQTSTVSSICNPAHQFIDRPAHINISIDHDWLQQLLREHTNSSTGQHTLIFQLTTIDYNSSCASTWIDYFHFWDLELHYHFRFPLTAPSLWWPLVSPLPRCPKSASSLGETAKSRRVVQPLGHM
jgi:hypothetical protein